MSVPIFSLIIATEKGGDIMKKPIVMAVIFISLAILSCKKPKPEENTGVAGYVYLSDTIPAPGVHVYDKSDPEFSVYTDSKGFFSLELPDGEHVVVIDGGVFKKEVSVNLSEGEVKELFSSDAPLVLKSDTKYKIAVMVGDYDAIQEVFDKIGIKQLQSPDDTGSGYVLYYPDNFPNNMETLRKFNLLAFNCGGTRPNINAATLNEYVAEGGNIYASDWQVEVLDSLSLIGNKVFLHTDNGDYHVGRTGIVEAKIVDNLLRSQIGKDSVSIDFDKEGWVMIDSVKTGINVLIQADVVDIAGFSVNNSPLSFITRPINNGGSVLYTSFHYEAQETNEDMLKVLTFYLIRIGQD